MSDDFIMVVLPWFIAAIITVVAIIYVGDKLGVFK